MPAAPLRFPVPSADLTDLVRVRGSTIAALVDRGAFEGQIYPGISTNDGASWVIDGPRFSGGDASGPSETDTLAVARDGTLVAWGRAGNLVRVLRPGSPRWDETAFADGTRHVVVAHGMITMLPDDRSDPDYVSRNDGLTWRRV